MIANTQTCSLHLIFDHSNSKAQWHNRYRGVDLFLPMLANPSDSIIEASWNRLHNSGKAFASCLCLPSSYFFFVLLAEDAQQTLANTSIANHHLRCCHPEPNIGKWQICRSLSNPQNESLRLWFLQQLTCRRDAWPRLARLSKIDFNKISIASLQIC